MRIVKLEGCHWFETGEAAFSGTAARLFRQLDRVFREWASGLQAKEFELPACIAAADLSRADYFRAFPQQAVFPVALQPADENLRRFVAGCDREHGTVHLTRTEPVRAALAPAACHHFYALLQQQNLEQKQVLTARARCHRREASHVPLQRQSSFSMREIVSIGRESEVRCDLEHLTGQVVGFCKAIGLPVDLLPATDPFFDPSHSPRYVMQRIEPVKTEIVYGGELAIGSINFHGSFFGHAFGIGCDGGAARSGCVAFGVERWMHAIADRFGPDPADWPVELREGARAHV